MSERPRSPQPAPRTASSRRSRYALNSIVTAVAATAACAFLLLIASRLSVQITALSTREHVLAERTRRMIEGLDADYQVIIAANFESIDPEGARRTLDVLDSFYRASDRIHVSVLDIDSPIALERGLDTMLVIAAIFRSAASGRKVRIDWQAGYVPDALH